MEHIIISPGKLKLMLTKNDLLRYELDCETMDSEDPATRRSLRELLADVKTSSGFDVSDDKLFIQLYPSRDGGAEIYITKLSAKRQPEPSHDAALHVTSVFRFDSMHALLDACARCAPSGISDGKASSAWQGELGYFLITEENIPYREYLNSGNKAFDELIAEAGTAIGSTPASAAYVREHCRCFCEREAISVLARLA